MLVEGKGGISARVIAKSVSSVNGQTVTTFELEYPRFIHSELMTHRLFSRNAASSRAIPINKVVEQVESNPAMPIHWGLNQKGMQASEEHSDVGRCEQAWRTISAMTTGFAESLDEEGLHKQIVNRILEPYQFIKVVVTATEFDNFFWLRYHSDAQPEIRELADCMYKAHQEAPEFTLSPGEWHTPYVGHMAGPRNELWYYLDDGHGDDLILTLEEALKVSASCCAQVSFRSLDTSLEKALRIYDMLIESKPMHASPVEHACTPMEKPNWRIAEDAWEDGATHMDREGDLWSGNFKGWIQHRQLLDDHTCWNFEKPVD